MEEDNSNETVISQTPEKESTKESVSGDEACESIPCVPQHPCNVPYPNYHSLYSQVEHLKSQNKIFVIIIVMTILVLGIILAGAILPFIFWPPGDWEDVTVTPRDFSATIADGGNYGFRIEIYSKMEITLSATSENGKLFDVYLMDENQYLAAYSKQTNLSQMAFSTMYSKENVSAIDSDSIEITCNYSCMEYYLVIDNRDTPLTLNDATPTGTIIVDVDLTMTETHEYYYM